MVLQRALSEFARQDGEKLKCTVESVAVKSMRPKAS